MRFCNVRILRLFSYLWGMRRILVLAAFAAVACGTRAPQEESMDQLRERVFAVAKVQAVHMDSLLTENRCPRTFQGDTLVTSDIG